MAALVLSALVGQAVVPAPAGAVAAFLPEGFERARVTGLGHGQRYHEGILLTGTPAFIERAAAALSLIEARDRRNWYFVRKHVRKITLTGHTGVDVVAGRLMSGEQGEAPAALGGSIVHEAWHRELFLQGKAWEGREAERFCLQRQNEFLALAGYPPLEVEEVLGSEYWKTDYWSRSW